MQYGGSLADDGSGGTWLLRLLHILGQGSLPVGRLFEAHVNALHLIMRYGTPAQKTAAAADARAGLLFGLWVTDGPGTKLRMRQEGELVTLTGGKSFCSAAGYAHRAVVTAERGDGAAQMLILPLGHGERVIRHESVMQGMRAATTGAVDFTDCLLSANAMLGAPGDYLREPEFSTGAWRGSAVALGGLASLIAHAREQLVARGRDGGPHQRARLGRAMIAHHTGWLWLERVAPLVHDGATDPAKAVAYVNLARTAVEAGCMESIQAIQRSLGLGAFVQANPVERLCRDLSTYLRQPAPDEALDEAAGYFMRHPLPGEPSC
jgi:alkylation response protein AidB-like acyl-CoA dehydrogenase